MQGGCQMRRQRNIARMEGQIKTPEKELNKMELSHLSDAEFKTLVIRLLKEPQQHKKDPVRNKGIQSLLK